MPIQSLVYYKLNVIKTLMSFVNIKIESFEILGKDIEKKLQFLDPMAQAKAPY